MRICAYEDRHVRGLEPLVLTRPAVDLLSGLSTLGEKHARYFGNGTVGHLCRASMADSIRSRDAFARVNDPSWLRAAPTILVNARWIPPSHTRSGGQSRGAWFNASNAFSDGPYLGTLEGEIAFAVLDAPSLAALSPKVLDDCLADWLQALPTREVGGTLISSLWQLIEANPGQIGRDFDCISDRASAGYHPTGFAIVGPPDRLLIHPSARIDPMVVADTTHGPVVIGPGAAVQAFTRLEGPCAIGEGTVLLGATIRAGTTIGPRCRIGGEIECSIVQGYANKYHEGFLGRSYVGEWTNLAAGSSTSDVRCDYRIVTVAIDGCEVPTGLTKVGSFIGDHARIGLGVLLDCGSTIGPFADVQPMGGFAPRTVAAFSRAGPSGVEELSDIDGTIATANLTMRRRGKELTSVLEALYRSIPIRSHTRPEVIPLRRSA